MKNLFFFNYSIFLFAYWINLQLMCTSAMLHTQLHAYSQCTARRTRKRMRNRTKKKIAVMKRSNYCKQNEIIQSVCVCVFPWPENVLVCAFLVLVHKPISIRSRRTYFHQNLIFKHAHNRWTNFRDKRKPKRTTTINKIISNYKIEENIKMMNVCADRSQNIIKLNGFVKFAHRKRIFVCFLVFFSSFRSNTHTNTNKCMSQNAPSIKSVAPTTQIISELNTLPHSHCVYQNLISFRFAALQLLGLFFFLSKLRIVGRFDLDFTIHIIYFVFRWRNHTTKQNYNLPDFIGFLLFCCYWRFVVTFKSISLANDILIINSICLKN